MSTFGGGSGGFTGLMQIVGGWIESVARTPVGFRVRTALGNSVELSHGDINGLLKSSKGKMVLDAETYIKFLKEISVTGSITGTGAVTGDGIFDGGTRIPAPSIVANLAALPVVPVLSQECFVTDQDLWVKYNGVEFRTLTGVPVDEL